MGTDDDARAGEDRDGGVVPCPECAEPIAAAARRCRACGAVLAAAVEPPSPGRAAAATSAPGRGGRRPSLRARAVLAAGVAALAAGLVVDVWFASGGAYHSAELGLWRIHECVSWTDDPGCQSMTTFAFAGRLREKALATEPDPSARSRLLGDARKLQAGAITFVALGAGAVLLLGVLVFGCSRRVAWVVYGSAAVTAAGVAWWLTIDRLFKMDLGPSLFLVPAGLAGAVVGVALVQRDGARGARGVPR